MGGKFGGELSYGGWFPEGRGRFSLGGNRVGAVLLAVGTGDSSIRKSFGGCFPQRIEHGQKRGEF